MDDDNTATMMFCLLLRSFPRVPESLLFCPSLIFHAHAIAL